MKKANSKTRVSLSEAKSMVGKSNFAKLLADQKNERQKLSAADKSPQRAPLTGRR